MSFQVTVAGIDEMDSFQMTTDVVLDRRIYEHSRARIVFHWTEDGRYSERQTATLAAEVLNCTVDVAWKAFDTSETTPCFHGYVEQVSGDREGGSSRLILNCVSFSQRADYAPRYRAFQKCKLLDICQQVAKSEPLVKINQSADLNFDIPLSVQYGETDYAYLSRMLHAWGVPVSVSDKTGEVTLGARGVAAASPFPDLDFRWTRISFSGTAGYYPKRQVSGSGPSKTARGQVDQLNGQVKDTATAYYPIPDTQPIKERHSTAHSQSDTASYHLTFQGGLLPFSPGEVVSFEGQDHIIRSIRVTGDVRVATAMQEFELQPFTLPYQPEFLPPAWSSRTLWAWVVDNEKDPAQRGRIQVTFDLESLDPQSGGDKVWLHTLTPYGGGKSPSSGKAGEYSGFYSLPEIGERVLVEFLGDWDSEAVVIGTVRDQSVNPMYDSKETKRWRLPSGTEVAMTSNDSVDIVRLRAKDKIFFEAKMGSSGPEFTITPGESDDDLIHFKTGELYVKCSGAITMVGQGALHLEGTQVQIKASGGNVNVDGAPNVMINCMPMPAMPLQVQKFTEKMGSVSPENRVLPSPILGTAATGGGSGAGSGSDSGDDSQTPDTPVTWIEIVLKDKQGVPIPNEPYRIKLADGTIQEGSLDGDGKARVDGIKPGTAQVSFPNRDGNEWKPT